jgi:hypothetical protein
LGFEFQAFDPGGAGFNLGGVLLLGARGGGTSPGLVAAGGLVTCERSGHKSAPWPPLDLEIAWVRPTFRLLSFIAMSIVVVIIGIPSEISAVSILGNVLLEADFRTTVWIHPGFRRVPTGIIEHQSESDGPKKSDYTEFAEVELPVFGVQQLFCEMKLVHYSFNCTLAKNCGVLAHMYMDQLQ